MQVLSLQHVKEAIQSAQFIVKCSDFHPGFTCNQKFIVNFLRVLKPVMKTYIPVHVVPFLLFKRKRFMQNPLLQLFKLVVGIIRSILFGAGYFCTLKRFSCLLFGNQRLTPLKIRIYSALGGISLLFQQTGRQAQIALFTMYRTFQTIYNMRIRKNLPARIPVGNCIITGIALCIICYHFTNNRKIIKGSFIQVLDKLFSNI